ncbi:BREX system P-loop protein BrxC [Orenia marismortui]|uniref:BREX system P-loop protein BrxC n=1 Tax=Orenia marismortui TaxID=46469 RepID=UPI00035F838E|nr:BREX system P-loop protein BrxC [Orenia marismortui]
MKLKQMFKKDITRDIKGVIKVGQSDEENIKQELEEYVVTHELEEYFERFYDAYKKGIDGLTDKMGVWVSGFFGSGKSHFIKILSYLLENKEIEEKAAIDFFEDKFKNDKLLEAIEQSGEIETDVILFNIDSKSDADSKSEKDAIVKVFMKVFNDYLGYCGDIPWLADLERTMDRDSTYEDFKAEFKKIIGDEWEDRRHDFYYEEDAIIEALVNTTKMSEETARNWYYSAENNYSLSVEKFAKLVQEYIEAKSNNHHLVFLVDEIGQYIGDDTQLMLNLQTVAEDLGTYCGGKAWVLVTSQQDIDSITKVQGGDFSKIQGRFDTRLSLSSANVDEVIQKRILDKKDEVKDTLRLLYGNKSSILKNLITFSADTAEMKNYVDEDNFANIYPFIPYQFDLLQKVFESIRLHGASGKHLSEGERSLLSAFQESALIYVDNELGKLVPFSAFYESIKDFLDASVSRVIKKAQERAEDSNSKLEEQDVEVLKVLFMIKYIDEVPANLENITTLMISDIDEDKIDLKEKIENSLKRLVKETLIQKNGPEYMFLTNEEQDINREIKSTKIDPDMVIDKIGEYVFEDIYPDRKYAYSTEYNFPFNKIIDKQHRGRPNGEVGVRIVTPFCLDSEEELRLASSANNNIIFKLPEGNLMDELEESLKLDKYLRKKGGMAKTEEIERIMSAKRRESNERNSRIKEILIQDLGEAEIYVKSERLEVKSSDPVKRINEGFKFLIETIYKKLNYIEEFTKDKSQLLKKINSNNNQLNFDDQIANHLAIDEIRRYISRRNERNLKTSLKKVMEDFQSAPYGWKELDIAAVVVELFKAQEIKLQYKGESIEKDNRRLIDYLTRNNYMEGLIITKRVKVEQRLINLARNLARDLFAKTAFPNDEDGLMEAIKEEMRVEIEARDTGINDLLNIYNENRDKDYPGEDILKRGKRAMESILEIRDAFEFYSALAENEDELLDYEEDAELLKNFLTGDQKKYYDKAWDTIEVYKDNQSYVLEKDIINLIEELQNILAMEEPYSEIYRIPELRNKFNDKFADLLDEESKPVKNVIKNDYEIVKDELAEKELPEVFEEKIKRGFINLLDRLDRANNLYQVIAMKEESDRLKIRSIEDIRKKVRELELKYKQEEEKNKDNKSSVKETPEKDDYKVKETEVISLAYILHGAQIIEEKDDIEEVLDVIRKKLQRELDADKRIKLV